MFIDTASRLEPVRRRRFMHLVVNRLGYGGQRYAERVLGWDRKMIRQGAREAQIGTSQPFSKSSQISSPKYFTGELKSKSMEPLSENMIKIYSQTANNLSGEKRRLFMAQVVNSLGRGGQRYVEEKLHWNRGTVRRGQKELSQQKQARQENKAERIDNINKQREKIRLSAAEQKPNIKASVSDELAKTYIETANRMSGLRRRIFMAQVVSTLGYGGQRLAEQKFGWNRRTVRLGMQDLQDRNAARKRLSNRGRKSVEARFPTFLTDIRELLAENDPKSLKNGKTTLKIQDIHRLLIHEKGYDPNTIPSRETVRKKLNKLLREIV